jgi:hypothetical protein
MRSSEYQPSSYSRDFEFKSQFTSGMRIEEQNLKLMKVQSMVAQCQLQQTDEIEMYDKCTSHAIDHLNSNFGQDQSKCVNLNFEDLRRLERNVRI